MSAPAPIDLTPEQKQLLARARAFIGANPPQHEFDQMLTLALMPVAPARGRDACEARSRRGQSRHECPPAGPLAAAVWRGRPASHRIKPVFNQPP